MNTFQKTTSENEKKTSIQLLLLHWIVNQPTDRPLCKKCFLTDHDYNNLDMNFRAIYL